MVTPTTLLIGCWCFFEKMSISGWALASKDVAAEDIIKKLNAEHGVTDAEFEERYSKVFEKFKNNQSAK